MKRILKWNVPVDDQEHEIGGGPVIHVDSQYGQDVGMLVVQVWTEEVEMTEMRKRTVRVVGTGHPFHDSGKAFGTVIVRGGALVWHVVEFP